MKVLSLAWRQLRRDVAAGDVRILFAALVLAVLAVTSVGFITDRAERALAMEANRLLGGDAVVRADEAVGGDIRRALGAPGLRHTETRELNTMIRVASADGERLQLGDLRALGEGYPLRGSYRVTTAARTDVHDATGIGVFHGVAGFYAGPNPFMGYGDVSVSNSGDIEASGFYAAAGIIATSYYGTTVTTMNSMCSTERRKLIRIM